MSRIEIFTDGASKNNNKKTNNRCGGIGVYCPEYKKYNLTEKFIDKVTNQRTELYAILRALQITADEKNIHIISDSMYAINVFTIWYKNWLKINKIPLNWDIIEPVINIITSKTNVRSVTFEHVNSHLKEPLNKQTREYYLWYGNNIADQFANFGCKL
jgi:ribonuclease HI